MKVKLTVRRSSRLNLQKLKEAALWNANEWVRKTAAVWMATSEEKLERLEQLLKVKVHTSAVMALKNRILEQSTTREEDAYIDVEILMTDVRESWSRLQSHSIQVPAAAQNRLKEIHTTAKRQMLQIL